METAPGQLLDGQEGKGTQGPKVIWAKGKEALSTAPGTCWPAYSDQRTLRPEMKHSSPQALAVPTLSIDSLFPP